MADTQFKLGEARQGYPHPSAQWRNKTLKAHNLPQITQMGEESSFKWTENHRINGELLRLYQLSKGVIQAFQPLTYQIGQYGLDSLKKYGPPIVKERICEMLNPLKPGICSCGRLSGTALTD